MKGSRIILFCAERRRMGEPDTLSCKRAGERGGVSRKRGSISVSQRKEGRRVIPFRGPPASVSRITSGMGLKRGKGVLAFSLFWKGAGREKCGSFSPCSLGASLEKREKQLGIATRSIEKTGYPEGKAFRIP